MFLHGGGNVNGVLSLTTDSTTTLMENPSIITSYADWNPAVATQLENKAASNAVVGMRNNGGSASFAMTFQTIPEPSTAALLFGGFVLSVYSRRKRNSIVP